MRDSPESGPQKKKICVATAVSNPQADGVSQVGVPIPSSQVVAPTDAQAQQTDDEVGNSYTNCPTGVDRAAAVYSAEARATFPA